MSFQIKIKKKKKGGGKPQYNTVTPVCDAAAACERFGVIFEPKFAKAPTRICCDVEGKRVAMLFWFFFFSPLIGLLRQARAGNLGRFLIKCCVVVCVVWDV